MLATVTEEVSGSSSTVTDSVDADRLSEEADSTISHQEESEESREAHSQEKDPLRKSAVTDPDLGHDGLFSSRRRHTRCSRDWSSDVCSSDLATCPNPPTA